LRNHEKQEDYLEDFGEKAAKSVQLKNSKSRAWAVSQCHC